jgi:hypothetical protein
MTILGYILLAVGCIVGLIGDVRFLVIAYRHSATWFILCLFIPLVGLLFFLLHVKETWRPVVLSTIGLTVAIAGYLLSDFSS